MKKPSKEFLETTYYCDLHNPAIRNLAERLTLDLTVDKMKAIRLFYWVRDNILYSVGNWKKKASETLKSHEGTCTNKANLLVALLRVSGIPAGYRVLRVKGRDYFGPIAPPSLIHRVRANTVHIHAYAFLNDKWIKCDPSDDIALSKKTSYFNPQSKVVEWNGENDAELNLDTTHIIEDLGLFSNVDHWIGKRPRYSKAIVVSLGNLYIKFLREYEEIIHDINILERHFKHWLRKHYPLHYIILHVDAAIYKLWISVKKPFI